MFADVDLLELAGLNAPQIMELSRSLCMSPLSYTVDEFANRWNAVMAEQHENNQDQEHEMKLRQEVIRNGIRS
ncbi:hypothetical protein D1872_289130 [compost metagenome]